MKLLKDEELGELGLRLGDRVMLRELCLEAVKSEYHLKHINGLGYVYNPFKLTWNI